MESVQIVPAGDAIADLLERKAKEYEAMAKNQAGPTATGLKKLAQICREWAAALRFGSWIP